MSVKKEQSTPYAIGELIYKDGKEYIYTPEGWIDITGSEDYEDTK